MSRNVEANANTAGVSMKYIKRNLYKISRTTTGCKTEFIYVAARGLQEALAVGMAETHPSEAVVGVAYHDVVYSE